MKKSILLAGIAVVSVLAVPNIVMADAKWQPQSVERLVKLPATYLTKSIDQDFRRSELGQAVIGAEKNIGLKAQSLGELNDAVTIADGEVKTELRHRVLVEKHAYLELMADRNDLRRKQLLTKRRLLDKLLNEIADQKGSDNPRQRALIAKQEEAQNRFESSISKVDIQLFNSVDAPQSKYGKKYAENMSAIENLAQKIDSHQMNESAKLNGKAVTQEEYVRALMADTESELAILQQEETILGYMAKLVALDAMALSEEGLNAEIADSDIPDMSSPAASVDLFIASN